MEEKIHILIKLTLFQKNVWASQYARNIRINLKLLIHFAIVLENNFLIDALQVFLSLLHVGVQSASHWLQ